MFICNQCDRKATHFYKIGSVTQPLCEEHTRAKLLFIIDSYLTVEQLQKAITGICSLGIDIEEAF